MTKKYKKNKKRRGPKQLEEEKSMQPKKEKKMWDGTQINKYEQ